MSTLQPWQFRYLAEELIEHAAERAGWRITKRKVSPWGSLYLSLQHDEAHKGVRVRVSDHPCRWWERNRRLVQVNYHQPAKGLGRLLRRLDRARKKAEAQHRGGPCGGRPEPHRPAQQT